MKPESDRLLHESELALQDTRAKFLQANSVNASFCEMGFTGVERAIKAYQMETTGNIAHTHSIVTLCQSSGLWPLLPSDLQKTIQEWAPFDPNVRYPGTTAYNTLTNSTTPEQLDRMTAKGLELNGFVRSLVTSGRS